MLISLIIFIVNAQPTKFSIRYGAVSKLTLKIDNVFHIELLDTLIDSGLKEDQVPKFADFCYAQNPAISINLQQTLPIGSSSTIQVVDDRVYSLNKEGYLKIMEIDQYLDLKSLSEVYVPLDQDSCTMQINKGNRNKVLVQEQNKIIIYEFQFNTNFNKVNTTYTLNTTLQIEKLFYINNKIFILDYGMLEIFKINQLFIEKTSQINLIEAIEDKINKMLDIIDYLLMTENTMMAYTRNGLYLIKFQNDKIEDIQFMNIHRINTANYYNGIIYIVQQIGITLSSQQYLLEIKDFQVHQNITLTTAVKQLFPTSNYIFILQENLLQIAFANINSIQMFSKNILEGPSQLLHYKDDKLIIHQDNLLAMYTIQKQKAQLVCEPNENYTTGDYRLEVKVGYFQEERISQLIQPIQLYVYQEIFENGNVGLYVGLSVGLVITFIAILVLCVIYYKLKAKYNLDLQQQRQSITLE